MSIFSPPLIRRSAPAILIAAIFISSEALGQQRDIRGVDSHRSAVESPQPHAIPQVPAPSRLKNINSAKGNEDRCEALLLWLHSGLPANLAAADLPRRIGPEMTVIFRDQPMVAVWGRPYDQMDAKERAKQHKKVISKCLNGNQRRRTVLGLVPYVGWIPGVGTRGPSRTMTSLAEQLAPFGRVLNEAFSPYEARGNWSAPLSIKNHLKQFRTESQWVADSMASATSAQAEKADFDRISKDRGDVTRQMSLFNNAERSQVSEYLASRQSAIAPAIADAWLTKASASSPNVESAKALAGDFATIEPVVGALAAGERAAWRDRYYQVLESLVADDIRSRMASLARVAPSLAGVSPLIAWKDDFDREYAAMRTIPAVQTASAAYVTTRERVYGAALNSWRRQVDSIPLSPSAISGKRRELDGLFAGERKSVDGWFAQFETPLRAKEDQIRAAVLAESRRSSYPTGESTGLTATSLSVEGLNDPDVVQSLYAGAFERIDFNRDDLRFQALYNNYLEAYSGNCGRFLPSNRVELTTQECKTERVMRNGYGIETSRSCVDWVSVPTGTFVSPAMREGHQTLAQLGVVDGIRLATRMMTQSVGDTLSSAAGLAQVGLRARADMNRLTEANACTSPALKRFEENLRLFALNQAPLRLAGARATVSINAVIPGLPFRDQNYERLMGDLIVDQARTWAINRLDGIRQVSVDSRDDFGRPRRISATYNYYTTFNQRARYEGSVYATFKDGLPECLYFFDAPGLCRAPARKIVTAYDSGSYER